MDFSKIYERQVFYPSGTKILIKEMNNLSMSKYNQKIGYVDFVDDLGYIFVKLRNFKKEFV